jgi:hypothetical protein
MANSKVFVSPGVYTSEVDLSFVASSVGITTLGIVGETLKGPAFEPIFISSYDEFQTMFGGTSPEKFVNTQIPKYEAAYIAKSYLQQSNQLFVTRILGLSGYDAGPSWSIKTIANVDQSTIAATGTTSPAPSNPTINFSAIGDTLTLVEASEFNYVFDPTGIPEIDNNLDVPYQKFDGSVSTFREDIVSFLQELVQTAIDGGVPAYENQPHIYYFGSIQDSDYATNLSNGLTASTNVFGVPGIPLSANTLTNPTNDPWYYSNFTNTNGNYYGFSFYINQTPGSGTFSNFTTYYTGFYEVFIQGFSGTSFTDYDNVVVSTLRSRGIATYTSDNGPVYQVSATTGVNMVCSGSYSAVTKNPFSTFKISGITRTNQAFEFETSMDATNTNFITKVFGTTNFEKPRTEVPLFVEERYSNMLRWAYNKGYIRGLSCDLIELDSARNNATSSIANYLEQYKTPETPWVVSELRGNTVYQLFKFVLISDGSEANTQVKISLANMSFENGTFDVLVRDYFDTDSNPVVIEKFTNCSLDPTLNNYVAQRIGTSDGEYRLISKFIMVKMNPDAPADALPCGFEGYVMREYSASTATIPPFAPYKTSYNFPGEVVYNPPFGIPSGAGVTITSSGDNVRRTYLGFSDKIGIDSDFLDYKGKKSVSDFCTINESDFQSWKYLTKGFHMDKDATGVTISNEYVTSGSVAFEVGAASFQSDPESQENPYYRISARKFTVLPYGGFDGWDIYREYRTNDDSFVLGGRGYRKGACSSARYPTANGEGLFRNITINQNEVDWANTDYYAYLLGIQTFANPESVNINVFVTPGIDYVNNPKLVEQTINMVELDRADSIYIVTTPDYQMFVPTTSFESDQILPEDAIDTLNNSDIDSNYTATYYPWLLTRDNVNNTQIYIPPTAEVTRNLALTDNVAFPWFATAGYTRGLVNSVKARKKLSQTDRDVLYEGRINPIATFSDVGTVIWGNKTLQIKQSALDRINVRRLLLQARKLISAVAVRLLFEQNDAIVRQQFLDAVNPILDSIRRDRGLYDFRVTVSNSVEDLDNNRLVGSIYIKPTKSLEFIDITFYITPTGASFENI